MSKVLALSLLVLALFTIGTYSSANCIHHKAQTCTHRTPTRIDRRDTTIKNAVHFDVNTNVLPGVFKFVNFCYSKAPSNAEVEIVFRRDDSAATEMVTFNNLDKAHGGNKSGVGETVTKSFNFIGSSVNGSGMTVECHFKRGGWGVGNFESAAPATVRDFTDSKSHQDGLAFTWTTLKQDDTVATVTWG